MALIIVVLVGMAALTAVALALSMGDHGLEDEPVDHPDLGIPDRPLTAADIPGLRFRVGWRGYRMDDVDAALDRLGAALRDAESGTSR